MSLTKRQKYSRGNIGGRDGSGLGYVNIPVIYCSSINNPTFSGKQ